MPQHPRLRINNSLCLWLYDTISFDLRLFDVADNWHRDIVSFCLLVWSSSHGWFVDKRLQFLCLGWRVESELNILLFLLLLLFLHCLIVLPYPLFGWLLHGVIVPFARLK